MAAVEPVEVIQAGDKALVPATWDSLEERNKQILYAAFIENKHHTVIAKEFGLSRQLIGKIVRDAAENKNIQALVSHEWKKRITHSAMAKAAECLDTLDVAEISHDKRYLTIGTLIDKVNILSGEPTEIVEHRQLETTKILNIFT